MEKNKTRIKFKNVTIALTNVIYERQPLSFDNKQGGSFKVLVDDEVKIKAISENGINLSYIRKVDLMPEDYMSIKVEFDCVFHFDDESKKYYDSDLQKITEFANLRKDEIIQNHNIVSRASLLVAQLTSNESLNPLITSPSLEKTNKE